MTQSHQVFTHSERRPPICGLLHRYEEENRTANRDTAGVIFPFGYLNLYFTAMIKGRAALHDFSK